jgi:hypothetical protein
MPSHLLILNPHLNPQSIDHPTSTNQPTLTPTPSNNTMSQSAPAPELKTYNGNCHCGAFKYTAKLPELTSTYPCNCSICFRKGYRWLFPGPGCFTVTKGEGTLKEYRFGPKKMAHMFCGTCGTGVYGKNEDAPPGMDIAINVGFQGQVRLRLGHGMLIEVNRSIHFKILASMSMISKPTITMAKPLTPNTSLLS